MTGGATPRVRRASGHYAARSRHAHAVTSRAGAGASFAGARILVLGAAGFIGRWVARALTRRGADLLLVVRDAQAAASVFDRWEATGAIVESSLQDARILTDLVRDLAPQVTFNLVGYGIDPAERDEEEARWVNVDLARALAEAVADARRPAWSGLDLVHVGSALEYGRAGGDLREDTVPQPTTLYGSTKLAGTLAVDEVTRARGLRAVTARLFTVYGPGEHRGRLLPSLLDAARRHAPIDLSAGTQLRDFTYVEDVAAGLLRLAALSATPNVVNLATGSLTTVREFVEAAGRVLRMPADHLRFGVLPTRSDEMAHEPVNVGRLREITAWTPPTTIADGVRRTWEFR
jgi:nucleoside-diphosphate-sugar epimerase